MPTFRSHMRHAPQQDESKSNIPCRVPSTKTSDVTEPKQNKAVQHVSKLARRASRSIATLDKPRLEQRKEEAMTKSTVPMTAPQQPRAASRRLSVTPASDKPINGLSASASTIRHDATPRYPLMRSSSHISGSTSSSRDPSKALGLRRKPSIINQYATKESGMTTTSMEDQTARAKNDTNGDAFENSILGISLPPASKSTYMTTNSPLDAPLVDLNGRRDLITPPVSNYSYAQTATPSTRYADSPFSHVPTPSSVSSYASGSTSNFVTAPRSRLQSPAAQSRPPVTKQTLERNDPPRSGLPLVREASNSSSNSTSKPSSEHKPPTVSDKAARRTSRSYDAPTSASRNKTLGDKDRSAPTGLRKQVAVRIPPELAHLNVDPPRKVSATRPVPPTRPSRDGTSSLADLSVPSPIVKSDLPRLYTTYHKRTPSIDTPNSTTSPASKSGYVSGVKNSLKQASPRVDSAISPPPSARLFTSTLASGTTNVSETQKSHRKDSPAIGSLPSPSKSPLRFFSRKPKPENEKPKREPKKGPAAGTGHEGYGRFGFRGRSGSVTSTNVARSPSSDSAASTISRPHTKRKSSSTSSKDGVELDEFLRERLNPVILRGSGSTFSNTATSSEYPAPSILASSTSSSLDSYPTPQLLPSAMRSTEDVSPAKAPSSQIRYNSGEVVTGSRNAFRRESPTRSFVPSRRMTGSNNSGPFDQRPIDSKIEVESSLDSPLITDDPFDGKEGLWLRPLKTDNTDKPKRKWNFFQRAHASPRADWTSQNAMRAEEPESEFDNMFNGSVAHYALLDAKEHVGIEEVDRMMQENETSTEGSATEDQHPQKMVPYERRHTSLLPSPPMPKEAVRFARTAERSIPAKKANRESSEQYQISKSLDHRYSIDMQQHIPTKIQQVSPIVQRDDVMFPEFRHEMFNSPERLKVADSPRQPRLSPVGRIPRVVSKRDRDRRLPDNSFSRPFARTHPHPNVKSSGVLQNHIRELASPIESTSQPTSSTSARSDAPSAEPKSSAHTYTPSVSTTRTSMDMQPSNELMFSPRKDSDISYSSNESWMATLAAQPPQIDDPWNEYNDLLDDMMPLRTPLSATSSCGVPFQYSDILNERSSFVRQSLPAEDIPQPLSFGFQDSTSGPVRHSTSGAILSVPQQIARFMQPSLSPLATPHTINDFIDHYGNRNSTSTISARASLAQQFRSSISQSNRSSLPPMRLSHSTTSGRHSMHSRSASLPEYPGNPHTSLSPSVRFSRDTQLLNIDENETLDDHTTPNSLRFAALMTSRSLSFGQVLFSPAHNEMRLADQPRILIVDGLGSDWSYYVAMNYPSATVYSLGPDTNASSATWADSEPPANHKHIPHERIDAAFPFPKGFFTAVVFRFPLAATEDMYQECVFECKRVLRPGGHLEIAVLDLDLINMGSQARKVIRDLKMRMQHRSPNVTLRNMSDVLLRLIGRRGFESIKRYVVGIPVAGSLPSSREVSADGSQAGSRSQSRDYTELASSLNKEIGFADLLKDGRSEQFDTGPGKKHTTDIATMAPKVGRWWYSTCYESALLSTDRSIWGDQSLLHECEQQNTSFRMLICCAQKPSQTRRRTMSV